jgi:hypothetical protein
MIAPVYESFDNITFIKKGASGKCRSLAEREPTGGFVELARVFL